MRYLTIAALGAFALTGCSDFVGDTESFVDRIEDPVLDDDDAIDFLATGVEEQFNDSFGFLTVLAAGLSDEYRYDQAVQGASFPTYGEIDERDILLENNSVGNLYRPLHQYRDLADGLLERVNGRIERDPETDPQDEFDANIRFGNFAGNFHGGIARYMLGTYFALNEGGPEAAEPGSPIDTSDVIPTSELYDEAQSRLAAAAGFIDDDYTQRVINSLRARIELYSGNCSEATSLANNGLQPGDAPFTGDYNLQSGNPQFFNAGRGRVQYVMSDEYISLGRPLDPTDPELEGDDRINEDGDPRVLYEFAPPSSATYDGPTFFRQANFLEQGEPIPFMSWQETSLIIAECNVLNDSDDDDTRDRINAIREAASVDALDDDGSDLEIDDILRERQLELFLQGARMVDQRRYDRFEAANGDYQYFPIPDEERERNPFLRGR